jgi:hypothetical protein
MWMWSWKIPRNFGEINGFLGKLHEDLKKKEDYIFIADGIPTLSTAR